jgi:hypothetical protein
MDAPNTGPVPPAQVRRPRLATGVAGCRLGLSVVLLGLAGVLAGAGLTGCSHAPPVKPWQRGNMARRAMSFDDGLEGRFKQHVFTAREGADGGYGYFSGGCGCN